MKLIIIAMVLNTISDSDINYIEKAYSEQQAKCAIATIERIQEAELDHEFFMETDNGSIIFDRFNVNYQIRCTQSHYIEIINGTRVFKEHHMMYYTQ